MNAAQIGFPDRVFDAVLLHLVLAVVSDPVACAQEAARVLRPGGRAAIFDKWLPEGEQPSPVRRALNGIARTAFSDINRQLGPILAQTDLRLRHREPVGLGGAYQASGEYTPQVADDYNTAVRNQVTGTPTFVVNGKVYVGPQSVDDFRRIFAEVAPDVTFSS